MISFEKENTYFRLQKYIINYYKHKNIELRDMAIKFIIFRFFNKNEKIVVDDKS
jgi:hypothetical protein